LNRAPLITGLALISLGVAAGYPEKGCTAIPDELMPMSTGREGWSAEEARAYRQGCDDNTLTGGEDDGAYAITLFYAIFAGASGVPENASFFDAMKSVTKLREPGQRFEYSSMNTMMMLMIAEQITGKPFHDLLTERVWSKSGMEGDAEPDLPPSGEPSACGIVASRLRDLARYGMLDTPS
jgi:CubicO group peptidase (beta-lactamase class C family)